MKHKMLLIVALILAMGTTVQAQQKRGDRGDRPDRPQGPSVEQMLARFDTSGNGELDATELEAMIDGMKARMQRMQKMKKGERPHKARAAKGQRQKQKRQSEKKGCDTKGCPTK